MEEKNIHEIIVAYLNKTLDENKEKEFYKWINQSEEHKILFFEVKAIFDANESLNYAIDTQKSWQKLLLKQRKIRIASYLVGASRYAAAVIIAVVVTSLFFATKSVTTHQNTSIQYISGNGIEANSMILPDSTVVTIGTNTRIYLASDYGVNNRTVRLEGEAYFEVAKDKNKPFFVEIKNQKIEALGTAFNVSDYELNDESVTTLAEGSVRVYTEGTNELIVLKPNDQLTFNKQHGTLTKLVVDAHEFSSWKTGYYKFQEANIVTILNRLGNVYGVEFKLATQRLNNVQFTGTFYRGQSIKELMAVINISVPIEYTIKEKEVIIK